MRTLASVARSALPPIIYHFITYVRRRILYGKYYSLFEIDKKLSKLLKIRGGYFVELGANDGITQSNTLYFEKEMGWRGVLVEPAMNKFIECLNNRSKENHIYCAACVPFEYKGECVWLKYYNLMTYTVNLSNDLPSIEEHEDSASKFISNQGGSTLFPARAVTLNELLVQSAAPNQIDLLSLDVEGAEMSVLRGIDHDTYRFRYIVIECRDIDPVRKYLCQFGYSLTEKLSKRDYLFSDSEE